MQIAEIIAGSEVKGLKSIVASVETKTAKNGKNYLSGLLMDQSGTIGFKVWDNIPLMTPLLAAGNVVEIKSGAVEEYLGTLSIKLASVVALPKTEASAYVQQAPVPFEDLKTKLEAALKALKLEECIEKLQKLGIWDKFLTLPAAMSHHHAYIHGLLQHTLEVYEGAMLLADMQKRYHNLDIDKTVLGAAALFHDIGKIFEYDINDCNLFTKFNDDGILLGHHFISANIASKVLQKLVDPIQSKRITHCILSHHGRLEWGAAVVPKTPEAYLLHLADMASSQPISAANEPKPLY